MENNEILKYLQDQSKLVEAISTPEGLLKSKSRLNITDLIAKYSNSDGKINKIKYQILNKLKDNQVFSIEELSELKKKNNVTTGMYDTYLSCTYTFIGENPRKQLKILSENLLNDLGITGEYSFTPSPFDGVRNSGEKIAWVALHPKGRDFRDSWQFFVAISPDGIECGKHSGRNLFVEYKKECRSVSTYNDILNVLNQYKDEIIKLNKELDLQRQPTDNIKKLTWWQISAIAMYLNNKDEKYKPVDVENLPFTQNAKIIKGQPKPSIATELRECSDDMTSKYNRKSKNCFIRLDDFYKLSKEGIEYIENDLKEFLDSKNENKVNTQMNKNQSIPLNQILYGPPGTGKTYKTAIEALKIVMAEDDYNKLDKENRKAVMAEYKKYKDNGQIRFITFHQSYAYEEFVEGIKPNLENDMQLSYQKKEGILREIAREANQNFDVSNKRTKVLNIDFDKTQIFKMSLGFTLSSEGEEVYNYCIDNNKLAMGFEAKIDLSKLDNREKIKAELKNISSDYVKDFSQMNYFRNELKKGDIVFISMGKKYYRAVGIVKDDHYEYNEDTEIRYNHFRNVEWLMKNVEIPTNKIQNNQISQKTLYKLGREVLNEEGVREILGQDYSPINKNYVLIIDEINRGNISKIFGELITLLEEDKRLYQDNALTLNLPYSENDKDFGLPPNLYFIGTMNTSDRSIAAIDIALRRRFEFVELMPDSSLVVQEIKYTDTIVNFKDIFETINNKIAVLLDRDHQIGHSYFIKDKFEHKSNEEQLRLFKNAWFDRIIPLLNEYFYGEWDKLEAILGKFTVKKAIPESLKGLYDEDYSFNFVSKSSLDNDEFIARLSELNDGNYQPLKAFEEK